MMGNQVLFSLFKRRKDVCPNTYWKFFNLIKARYIKHTIERQDICLILFPSDCKSLGIYKNLRKMTGCSLTYLECSYASQVIQKLFQEFRNFIETWNKKKATSTYLITEQRIILLLAVSTHFCTMINLKSKTM